MVIEDELIIGIWDDGEGLSVVGNLYKLSYKSKDHPTCRMCINYYNNTEKSMGYYVNMPNLKAYTRCVPGDKLSICFAAFRPLTKAEKIMIGVYIE